MASDFAYLGDDYSIINAVINTYDVENQRWFNGINDFIYVSQDEQYCTTGGYETNSSYCWIAVYNIADITSGVITTSQQPIVTYHNISRNNSLYYGTPRFLTNSIVITGGGNGASTNKYWAEAIKWDSSNVASNLPMNDTWVLYRQDMNTINLSMGVPLLQSGLYRS